MNWYRLIFFFIAGSFVLLGVIDQHTSIDISGAYGFIVFIVVVAFVVLELTENGGTEFVSGDGGSSYGGDSGDSGCSDGGGGNGGGE
ncbi:hypothetical protein [Lihuaxuella thermophila]|uniref:hypothetical protein n=1 Tax=Lihuaxuella thermophila TaxID=1173111 RepID=UPI00111340B5|nr:hypothetical protein [Lihuaxuella thermophila]